jgi:DNA replication and repair protein RecF
MVRFGADAARVVLRGTNVENAFETDVVLAPGDTRRARLNGHRLASAERLRLELRTLVFTPDRLAVVKGAPAIRRAYIDRSLGRLSPAKASLPTAYATAVGQRNAALRRLRDGSSSREALRPWTERVVTLATELVVARTETVVTLGKPFAELAGSLGLDAAAISYEGEAPTIGDLEARLERDLQRGVTGAGPHLHDVRIEAAGRDLRVFGSQGEQRMAVLSLVLAEADVLRSRSTAAPLMLLDDVLSELDGNRRRALGEIVAGGGQTVVTATTREALPVEPAQALAVTPGSVR